MKNKIKLETKLIVSAFLFGPLCYVSFLLCTYIDDCNRNNCFDINDGVFIYYVPNIINTTSIPFFLVSLAIAIFFICIWKIAKKTILRNIISFFILIYSIIFWAIIPFILIYIPRLFFIQEDLGGREII